MKEVSCRQFGYWFKLIRENGGSVDRAIRRMPYTQEYLLTSGNRIDWREYVKFCNDAVYELGGEQRSRQIQQTYGSSRELSYVSRVAGLLATPRQVYDFIILRHGRSLYTHLDFAVEDCPDGRLQIRIRIPEEYEDCPSFFWGSEPGFASMTRLIGLPAAEIETEVSPRLGVYTLRLPESRSLLNRLRRLVHRFIWPFSMMSLVNSQQQELRQLVGEMQHERDILNQLISSLPVGILIVQEGKMIFQNAALREMLGPVNEDQTLLPYLLQAARGVRILLGPDRLGEVVSRSSTTYQGEPAEIIVVRDVTELQRVEGRIIESVARDREKLAQDLHDGLGQYFAALNYKTSALAGEVGIPIASLEEVTSLVREAAAFSRDLVYGLGPGYAEARDMVASLAKLCERMQRMFEAEFLMVSDVPQATVPLVFAADLFLLVKEMLTNAARHADALLITVRLRSHETGWTLSVEDDGKGFDLVALPVHDGLGLEAMKVRAGRLGGHVRIESSPGAGCKVFIDLPPAVLRTVPESGGEAVTLEPSGVRILRELRVFVVDDHAIVRDGLRRLLQMASGTVLCGESADGENLASQLRETGANVLITDLMLGHDVDFSRISAIRREFPRLRIIVLSMFDLHPYGNEALKAGADLFFHKGDPPQNLLDALRPVA